MNDLYEIVKKLKGKKKILVTGPCRSGTTITCHILSKLLGLEFIESYPNEDTESIRYCTPTIQGFLAMTTHKEIDNYIVHGPHFHPFLLDVPEDVFIVFMRRNQEDVISSTKDIYDGEWTDKFYHKRMREQIDKKHYKFFDKLSYPGRTYFFWDRYQKDKIKNHIEIDYECMAQHELFIPEKHRDGFRERQWQK